MTLVARRPGCPILSLLLCLRVLEVAKRHCLPVATAVLLRAHLLLSS